MNTRRKHDERLKAFGVTVQTEFQDNGRLKIRRSDGTINDDVQSGVILDKKYFAGQELKRQETEFNPGILYSFTFPKFDEDRVICPNCGGVGKPDRFTQGCPFCDSYYNIECSEKDLGSRAHADYVSHGKLRLLPMALSIAVCIAAAVAISIASGRTVRPFDIAKACGIGVFAGALLGLLWSYWKSKGEITAADAQKKSLQESMLQTLQERLTAAGSSLSEYTNALVTALEAYYFGDRPETADVIDFDVLDYTKHTVSNNEAGEMTLETEVLLRPVYFRNGALRAEETTLAVTMKKNKAKADVLKPGVNFRSCPNCGASLDLSEPRCGYCGAPVKYEKPFITERIESV